MVATNSRNFFTVERVSGGPSRSVSGEGIVRRRGRRRVVGVDPKPTTLAFCGAGTISVVHAMAAAMVSMPVVAVASRTAERAAERAGQVGAHPMRYDELPAGADAVIVATPPACHCADTIQALEAGAAVLVEKPLATTLDEADAIMAAVARTGRAVVYAENWAFSPAVGSALALVRSLGPLHHVALRSLQPAPGWGGFLEPEWGGGVLFDLGVHPLALALLVAGDDTLVDVVADLEHGERAVDDLARVTLRFASSLVATVECSWRHQTTEWDLEVASDSGVVRLELMPEVALEHNGEPVPLAPTRAGGDPRLEQLGYVAQLEALGAAARGEPSWCDAGFGRRVLEVVAAAYTSAGLGGEPVPLPFTGRRDLTPLELWRGA